MADTLTATTANMTPAGLNLRIQIIEWQEAGARAEVLAALAAGADAQQAKEVEVLVISVLNDEASVVTAIAAGASGYILKDALPEDIAETVEVVLQGHSPLSAGIARFLLRRLHTKDEPSPLGMPKLTKREIDILWGIAKGFTYNDIADSLGISRKTVPNYIKSIYRKLEVTNRSEAVFEALQRKLIQL